ncbi:hypothetical protein CVT26_013507 [Gymnopilus dilepis]|uniref:Uncharacterized protein n=1 Tax=Gymnopilus dilepis TaxID=231916 RepID=A0A409Y5N6_9AGAR|nr:hypothetical protein CVT26_013507 [Gymnopilus dilepis]
MLTKKRDHLRGTRQVTATIRVAFGGGFAWSSGGDSPGLCVARSVVFGLCDLLSTFSLGFVVYNHPQTQGDNSRQTTGDNRLEKIRLEKIRPQHLVCHSLHLHVLSPSMKRKISTNGGRYFDAGFVSSDEEVDISADCHASSGDVKYSYTPPSTKRQPKPANSAGTSTFEAFSGPQIQDERTSLPSHGAQQDSPHVDRQEQSNERKPKCKQRTACSTENMKDVLDALVNVAAKTQSFAAEHAPKAL